MDDDTHQRASAQPQRAEFLTAKDIQRELRIGEKLAYRLLKDGTIPSVRVGGVYRVYRPHLLETLLNNAELGKKREPAPAKVPAPDPKGSTLEIISD